MGNKENDIRMWIVVLLLFVILLCYIGSLGKLNTEKISSLPDEFKESREVSKSRHTKLKALIEKQQGLKARLDKRFRWVYFTVRLLSIVIWLTFLVALYFAGFITNLGDAMNYSEAMILFLFTINFLTFGTISKFDNFLISLKTKTENWVYGKYLKLEEKIALNKENEAKLQGLLVE